jgi:GTP-binding protein HflX
MMDGEERSKAVLVSVWLPGITEEEHRGDLAELGRLVTTLGLKVVGEVTQRRERVSTGTVLGEGKLKELADWTGGSGRPQPIIKRKNKLRDRREKEAEAAREHDDDGAQTDEDEDDFDDHGEGGAEGEGTDDSGGRLDDHARENAKADIVIVDHELTPSQQRNLERATGAEVLDRSSVIVEIFHRHAKSRKAKLEVEIARLTYVAPRLREAGAGADRQRGGIGGKGAGESAVELDRRRIRDRIAELKREIALIETEDKTRRAARREARRVALVGYTNAGKSSLMRALTGSSVLVEDKLFATLDTTVRSLKPEVEPRVLVSDTVGFIKKLPHELVASFRSTLDEALEASLLLYVVDASDPTFRAQLGVTREVLDEIGAVGTPSLLLLNKRDRLDADAVSALEREFPDAVILSSKAPADVAMLRERIITFFDGAFAEREIFVPYASHKFVKQIYDSASVLGERHDGEGTHLMVRAPSAVLDRLAIAVPH